MSHLLLLLNLSHAFVSFFKEQSLTWWPSFLHLKQVMSLLWFKLHLGGLGGFAVLPRCGTTALGWGTIASWNLCSLEWSYCILDRLHYSKLSIDFATTRFVTFLMGLDAWFGWSLLKLLHYVFTVISRRWALHFPFNWIKSLFSLSTSSMSSLFSFVMESSQVSISTCSMKGWLAWEQ
jgi:hypothetical protein